MNTLSMLTLLSALVCPAISGATRAEEPRSETRAQCLTSRMTNIESTAKFLQQKTVALDAQLHYATLRVRDNLALIKKDAGETRTYIRNALTNPMSTDLDAALIKSSIKLSSLHNSVASLALNVLELRNPVAEKAVAEMSKKLTDVRRAIPAEHPDQGCAPANR